MSVQQTGPWSWKVRIPNPHGEPPEVVAERFQELVEAELARRLDVWAKEYAEGFNDPRGRERG